MGIPKTTSLAYEYLCPGCGANVNFGKLVTCSNAGQKLCCGICQKVFKAREVVRRVVDIELEEPAKTTAFITDEPELELYTEQPWKTEGVQLDEDEQAQIEHAKSNDIPIYQGTKTGEIRFGEPPTKEEPEKDQKFCIICLNCGDAQLPWVDGQWIIDHPTTGCARCGLTFSSAQGAQLRETTLENPPEPSAPQTHDSVYKQIEDRCGVSHSSLAEDIIQRDIPRVPQLYLALASKYMVRVGCKEEWEKDAGKILNYVHKAITGKWFNEGGLQ